MSIKSIRLKNFTIFKDLTVDLANGINVLIGKNGTGKTHLLKALYGSCAASMESNNLAVNFIRCFKENASFINILNDKKISRADIYVDIYDNVAESTVRMNTVSLSKESEELVWSGYAVHLPQGAVLDAVYIPAKDMLTHAKGLLAMSEKYREFPFDMTLTDIIRKANQWTVKQPTNVAKSILPVLEKLMDGEVITDNDEFFIKKHDGRRISFAIESEGIKKIGLLWRLLMNESITENSILLWDEPEANMNPEYLPIVVESLLELSRHNVQILVSTHNYIFAKYFDVRRKETDVLKFHALYEDVHCVRCETRDSFSDIEHNEITHTFDKLLDEVYDLDKGE